MIALDTNVLVRWFADDDKAQTDAAEMLFSSLAEDNPGFVNLTVMSELVWVLDRSIGMRAETLHDTIEWLLSSVEIEVEDEESVDRALRAARQGADFADTLIAATSDLYGCSETVTFDRKAAQRFGWRLLA